MWVEQIKATTTSHSAIVRTHPARRQTHALSLTIFLKDHRVTPACSRSDTGGPYGQSQEPFKLMSSVTQQIEDKKSTRLVSSLQMTSFML